MGQAAPLALGLASAAAVIALCAALVGPRLWRTMDELSGAAHRAQWWTRLCCAALVIGSLVAALLGYWVRGTAPTLLTDLLAVGQGYVVFALILSDARQPEAFWAVIEMLRWTLAALELSLIAISAVVL